MAIIKCILAEQGENKGYVAQSTAPSNTNLLWIDTSVKTIKYWDGSKWMSDVAVNPTQVDTAIQAAILDSWEGSY